MAGGDASIAQLPPYRCQVWVHITQGILPAPARRARASIVSGVQPQQSSLLPDAGRRKGRGAEPVAGLAHDLARLGAWALAVGDSASGDRGPQEQVRVGKGSKEDGAAVIRLPGLTTSDSE